jgi:hypothetical protein
VKGISAGRSGWLQPAWAMWLPCVFAVVVAALFIVLTRMLVQDHP